MLRPLRALGSFVALALVVTLTVTSAGAAEPETPWAVANDTRRQELLHRNWPTDGVPGSVLVTATTDDAAADIADREDGRIVGERSVLLHVDPGDEGATAARIAARGGVLGVEPDRLREPAMTPNDPRFASGEQWSHTMTSVAAAWDVTTGDASVTVAVLDSGAEGDHPDLAANIVEQVDLSSGTPRVWPTLRDNDTCNMGHGTFVAGVIGGVGNNGEGVAGVAWDVSIVDVSLTSHASRCGFLDSAIIAGLAYVSDPDRPDGPVDIVNVSLGGVADACTTGLQAALDDARAQGTLVIAAAGNDQLRIEGATSIPASCNGVLSVGAVGELGTVAPYSNQNDWVDILAPGGDASTGRGIVSTASGDAYDVFEGTSFAAPYVAGIAALLRSVDDSLTVDDLESILESTAGSNGVVNASLAVQAAVTGDPDEPEDDPPFPVDAGAAIERIAGSGTSTEPIAQAVAVSEHAYDALSAVHAVIARRDDFADALAGSALGYGIGPLLFSSSDGPLADLTRGELQRVLEQGSTVYLLGGTAALPASLEEEITDLGFEPVRLAGTTRQETAVRIAEELETFLAENEFIQPDVAIVATAFNWPDAVSVGGMGAWFGLPILVTSPTVLDAPVEDFLSDRDWAKVYVVGGTAAISEDVRRAIRDAAGLTSATTVRLAGTNRSGTMIAVGEEFEEVYSRQFEIAFGVTAVPPLVAGVNLRRADGFAHVLSASALVGRSAGVFVPVEGEGGTEITDDAQFYICRFPAAGIVVGAEDLITEETALLLDALMAGSAPACTGAKVR